MKTLSGVLVVFLLSAFVVSAGYAKPQLYGEAISNRQVTAIKDILADPKGYAGKPVTIEECPTGCWFYVKAADGSVTIYVDIGKAGLAIPPYQGKKVLVEGIVTTKGTEVMIEGRGVEVL
ncbi:MAG: hypothetical protein WC331_10535 [Candidatus Omnitrophota bacterium]|jgi:hypothetical protein